MKQQATKHWFDQIQSLENTFTANLPGPQNLTPKPAHLKKAGEQNIEIKWVFSLPTKTIIFHDSEASC